MKKKATFKLTDEDYKKMIEYLRKKEKENSKIVRRTRFK